jgi:hypothetical protein
LWVFALLFESGKELVGGGTGSGIRVKCVAGCNDILAEPALELAVPLADEAKAIEDDIRFVRVLAGADFLSD